MDTRSTRPGGHVGFVGVSHDVSIPGEEFYFSHVHLHGGPAPVRRLLRELRSHSDTANPARRRRLNCEETEIMTTTSLPSFRGLRDRPWRFALPFAAATAFSIAACASGSEGTADQTVGSSLPSTAGPSSSPNAPSPSTSSGFPSASESAAAEEPEASGTPIRVTIGDTVLTGQLWGNTTARDLLAQLPLTLTFSDLNNVEKIARVPSELSTDGVPEGDDPVPQDIGYYAPSGDLVFYYGDVGYFDGIVRIGQFNGSMDVIANATGDFMATVEVAE